MQNLSCFSEIHTLPPEVGQIRPLQLFGCKLQYLVPSTYIFLTSTFMGTCELTKWADIMTIHIWLERVHVG